MRIIAGDKRGRKLISPSDEKTTRPITDRVKETLFNKLSSLGLLGEGLVCDIFCGTGSLGLEALSRGADRCLFVERDKDAVKRLTENIQAFSFEDKTQINSSDGFTPLWLVPIKDSAIRIVFLDPPYANMHDEQYRKRINKLLIALYPKLENGGIVALRSQKEDSAIEIEQNSEENNTNYIGPRSFTYGNMALHFYQRPVAVSSEQ